jgi:hypothetical protein
MPPSTMKTNDWIALHEVCLQLQRASSVGELQRIASFHLPKLLSCTAAYAPRAVERSLLPLRGDSQQIRNSLPAEFEPFTVELNESAVEPLILRFRRPLPLTDNLKLNIAIISDHLRVAYHRIQELRVTTER